jgi:hypothetical protein
VVRRVFGERAIELGFLWWFAESVRPCNGAILTVALVVRKVQEFVTLQRSDFDRLLWRFTEGIQPCKRAIFDVRDGQMADRLVVIGKKQYLSSLWNRIIGKVIDSCSPLRLE